MQHLHDRLTSDQKRWIAQQHDKVLRHRLANHVSPLGLNFLARLRVLTQAGWRANFDGSGLSNPHTGRRFGMMQAIEHTLKLHPQTHNRVPNHTQEMRDAAHAELLESANRIDKHL